MHCNCIEWRGRCQGQELLEVLASLTQAAGMGAATAQPGPTR